MQFAEDKCKILRITRKLPRNIIIKDYKIHNYPLESETSAKYLGVVIDNRLNFNEHIDEICTKADRARQFPQRNIKEPGLVVTPSLPGAELFLWASGVSGASGIELLKEGVPMVTGKLEIPEGSFAFMHRQETSQGDG